MIGISAFKLAYQLSPILLVDGLASTIPGKVLPLIAITQAANFNLDLLNGTSPISENAFFANFWPLPGSTLFDQDIATYPFANQVIAANAAIGKPLVLSMRMECPANQPGAYTSKQITLTALKEALDTHSNLGGSFTVTTPGYLYQNLILLTVRDVTSDTKKAQEAFQFDFIQPLITENQAAAVLGNLLRKVTGGLPATSTSWTGQ